MNKICKMAMLIAVTLILLVIPNIFGTQGANNNNSAISDQKAANQYRVNDAHLHYVDFLQNTDGMKVLLEAMDQSGVEHAMLNGLPLVKKWNAVDPRKPLYYLADDSRTYWYSAVDVLVARGVKSLAEEDQRRFHPFICGFNPTDRNAIDHVRRMFEWYPDFWEGIGEVLTRHDDLTALTYGEQARANHIALDPVYVFAAEEDLPVWVHSDVSSVWVEDPLYLCEMEEAVKNHPKTRFVWAHAGISRRVVVPTLLQELRRMLKAYPNLWVDLSWVVYPMDVAPGGTPDERWVASVENFPGRFMIGTDKIGHFEDYEETISQYYVFLDALSPETARLVARENFLSILPHRVREELAQDYPEEESSQALELTLGPHPRLQAARFLPSLSMFHKATVS